MQSLEILDYNQMMQIQLEATRLLLDNINKRESIEFIFQEELTFVYLFLSYAVNSQTIHLILEYVKEKHSDSRVVYKSLCRSFKIISEINPKDYYNPG